MRIYLLLLSSALIFNLNLKAQDPIFSQPYANGMYLNPALTASDDHMRFGLAHRNQWSGLDAKFVTSSAAFETPIKNSNSAIGLLFVNDRQGNDVLTSNNLSFNYRYSIKIRNGLYMNAGLQLGLGQRSLNMENLIFEDQFNAYGENLGASSEQIQNQQRFYPDFSTGFMLMSTNFYAGFSLHHLNQPNISFVDQDKRNLAMKKTIHGGAKLKLNGMQKTNGFYSPNFIIQQQGESTTFSLGNFIKHRDFTAGVWYRWGSAVVVNAGFEVNQFSFGYSVDLNTNRTINPGLSHELSLAYKIKPNNQQKRVKRDNLVFCPKF